MFSVLRYRVDGPVTHKDLLLLIKEHRGSVCMKTEANNQKNNPPLKTFSKACWISPSEGWRSHAVKNLGKSDFRSRSPWANFLKVCSYSVKSKIHSYTVIYISFDSEVI